MIGNFSFDLKSLGGFCCIDFLQIGNFYREIVADKKSRGNILSVVFGYQFKSGLYDTARLRENVENSFKSAVEGYNSLKNAIPVVLEFRPLAVGYGEHLFNEICRDIISADIAVFDTSDLNPNVMLEMGVALTWDG